MKVAVQCESPLLQRSLELFLSPYLTTFKQCNVVVRDRPGEASSKPVLLVSNDGEGGLRKPFSRSQLMLALEKLLGNMKGVKQVAALTEALDKEPEIPVADEASQPDFSALEAQLDALTREYQNNVMKAVRAFYEK